MVDNFCNFSFEYRNNEKISIDENTALTAKEILLKNLAKIIEEVKLIEKDFNRNNSFQTVVQTKILSNYGFQPELSLETGKVKKDSVELDNCFDYEKFVENNEFKKPIPTQNETEESIVENKVADIANPQSESGMFSLIVVMISMIIISSLCLIMSSLTPSKTDQIFSEKIHKIEEKISKNYSRDKFSDLSNESLIKSKILTNDDLKTPWGATIEINNDSYGVKNVGHYSLTFNMVSQYSRNQYKGDDCENVSHIINNYSAISFAQYVIKTKDDISKADFMSYCKGESKANNVYLNIPIKSITLISK
jgi:hypothetical protein